MTQLPRRPLLPPCLASGRCPHKLVSLAELQLGWELPRQTLSRLRAPGTRALTSGCAPAGARAQTPAGRGLRRRPPPSAARVLAARPPFFLSFRPFLSVLFACSFPSNRSKILMLLLNQSNIFTVEPRRKEGVCIEGSFILSFNRLQIRLFIHYILLE